MVEHSPKIIASEEKATTTCGCVRGCCVCVRMDVCVLCGGVKVWCACVRARARERLRLYTCGCVSVRVCVSVPVPHEAKADSDSCTWFSSSCLHLSPGDGKVSEVEFVVVWSALSH